MPPLSSVSKRRLVNSGAWNPCMCTGRTHSFEYWSDTNLSSNSQVTGAV